MQLAGNMDCPASTQPSVWTQTTDTTGCAGGGGGNDNACTTSHVCLLTVDVDCASCGGTNCDSDPPPNQSGVCDDPSSNFGCTDAGAAVNDMFTNSVYTDANDEEQHELFPYTAYDGSDIKPSSTACVEEGE